MSSVGELSLNRGSGVSGEAGVEAGREPVTRPLRPVPPPLTARQEFIARCTVQSLVVWRGAAPFLGAGAPAAGGDRVHSAASHEEAHARLEDRLARPAVVAERPTGS